MCTEPVKIQHNLKSMHYPGLFMTIGYTQQDDRFSTEFSDKLPLLRSLWNECDGPFSNSNDACTLVKLPLFWGFFADSFFIVSF